MSGKKKDLQATIEESLAEMFAAKEAPDDARMKLLKLGIAYLAVKNKLEENQYGGFFTADGDPGDQAPGKEPASRGRANGAGAAGARES